MFCRKCGTKLDDDAAFCHSCGEKVTVPAKEEDKAKDEGDTVKECPTAEAAPANTNKPIENAPTEPAPERIVKTEEMNHQDLYVPDKDFMEFLWPSENASRLNRLRYFKRIMALNVIIILMLLVVPLSAIKLDCIYIIWRIRQDTRRLKDLGKGAVLAGIRAACGLAANGLVWKFGDSWDETSKMVPSEVLCLVAFLAASVIGLYLLFAPGDKGPNQYGADPLGPTAN